MATVYVSGKVVKLLANKGFTLVEELRNGEWEQKNYYAVWTKDLPVVGAEVKVKGSLSVKIREYEGKQTLQVAINAKSVESVSTAPVNALSADEAFPF